MRLLRFGEVVLVVGAAAVRFTFFIFELTLKLAAAGCLILEKTKSEWLFEVNVDGFGEVFLEAAVVVPFSPWDLAAVSS